MIVRQNKGYETRSDKLNEDWYGQENYVVDETTPEGKALARKIVKYYPRYDFIIENNQLTDITGYELVEITCSSSTTINIPIDISVSALNGDGIEAILYIDDIEQARDLMPTTWQVQFDSIGNYLIEVDAGKHGKVSKVVKVE